MTTEQSGDPEHGYVVTLDDITELTGRQRLAAVLMLVLFVLVFVPYIIHAL